MIGVDGGGGVYLQAVIVLPGVFEQAVHGVQDFVGQQEEPLPAERQDGGHYCTNGGLEICRSRAQRCAHFGAVNECRTKHIWQLK